MGGIVAKGVSEGAASGEGGTNCPPETTEETGSEAGGTTGATIGIEAGAGVSAIGVIMEGETADSEGALREGAGRATLTGDAIEDCDGSGDGEG